MRNMPVIAFVATLVVAVGFDFVSRRIPNWLVLLGVAAGFSCNAFMPSGAGLFVSDGGGIGVWNAALGMLIGGCLFLLPYKMGAMGAGDVKLMAAIGVFLGAVQTVGAVLLTLIAGGVFALAASILSGTLIQVLNNLRLMLLVVVAGSNSGLSLSEVPISGRIPYALAIACGTLAQIVLARYTSWPFA